MHAWIAFFVSIGLLILFAAVAGVTSFDASSQILMGLIVIVVVSAAISAWLIYVAMKAQYRRIKTGEEALFGAVGVAVTDLKPKGEVRVMGEFWQATSKNSSISNGQAVEVVGLEGMFLVVVPIKEKA